MNRSNWKRAHQDITEVFNRLNELSLIALQKAGTTQSDGFSDCVELYNAQQLNQDAFLGFCFYTGQDEKRAKKTSELPLAIWGSPEGDDKATETIGQLVVDIFTDSGFTVEWNGSSKTRPILYLHGYSAK
ncbi:MAG: hypothetical protein L3J22_10455 [Xanthomonadales bacterium]|nr:hypothetical protein [Xanthomonadales bacterium]